MNRQINLFGRNILHLSPKIKHFFHSIERKTISSKFQSFWDLFSEVEEREKFLNSININIVFYSFKNFFMNIKSLFKRFRREMSFKRVLSIWRKDRLKSYFKDKVNSKNIVEPSGGAQFEDYPRIYFKILNKQNRCFQFIFLPEYFLWTTCV